MTGGQAVCLLGAHAAPSGQCTLENRSNVKIARATGGENEARHEALAGGAVRNVGVILGSSNQAFAWWPAGANTLAWPPAV